MMPEQARWRFAQARVARLATADASGRPHLVPMVFALAGDTIYSAVDAKPKRSTSLRRLANIAANPRVAVLVDHYDGDCNELWWVRADGSARDSRGRRARGSRRRRTAGRALSPVPWAAAARSSAGDQRRALVELVSRRQLSPRVT